MKAKRYTRETIRNVGMEPRNFPAFSIGDTISVSIRIKEESTGKEAPKERIQLFEGDVIAFHNNGISTTFTVRKIGANSVSVEKIFPYYSPVIAGVKFIRKGKVRRAKLYYMRERVGRASRVEELVLTKEEKEAQTAAAGKNNQQEVAAQ